MAARGFWERMYFGWGEHRGAIRTLLPAILLIEVAAMGWSYVDGGSESLKETAVDILWIDAGIVSVLAVAPTLAAIFFSLWKRSDPPSGGH